MARNMHSNYYEDTYVKHECQSCKRCFILGATLAERMSLSCPYCQSPDIEAIAASTEESAENMDMGCLGIYFSTYNDGELMLYTEHEFSRVIKKSVDESSGRIPLNSVHEIVRDYCSQRDGRSKFNHA